MSEPTSPGYSWRYSGPPWYWWLGVLVLLAGVAWTVRFFDLRNQVRHTPATQRRVSAQPALVFAPQLDSTNAMAPGRSLNPAPETSPLPPSGKRPPAAVTSPGVKYLDPFHEEGGDARKLNPQLMSFLADRLTEARAGIQRPEPASLQEAERLADYAFYQIRYEASDEGWLPPAVTVARGKGDCAQKSMWLADALLKAGYREVGIRMGVPAAYKPGQAGHAWVTLWYKGSEYSLDPTSSGRALLSRLGPNNSYSITGTVLSCPK